MLTNWITRTFRVLVGVLATAMLAGAVWLTQNAPAPEADAVTAQEAFILKVAPAAQQGYREFKVPASVTIAQAILESGWGKSTLSTDYNNYFGIKCGTTTSPYQSGCVAKSTTEYNPDGSSYVIVDKFRTYSSIANSFRDHGYFLSSRSRYANAFNYSNNPRRFAEEIHRAGYATDPGYANYLYKLMAQYNLFRFDFGQTLGEPVVRPTNSVNPLVATPTPTASVTPTPTPTPRVSTTPAAEPSATVTPTPSASATPSQTPATDSPTPTPTPSASEHTPTPPPPSPSKATPAPSLAPQGVDTRSVEPTPTPDASSPAPTSEPTSSEPTTTSADPSDDSGENATPVITVDPERPGLPSTGW